MGVAARASSVWHMASARALPLRPQRTECTTLGLHATSPAAATHGNAVEALTSSVALKNALYSPGKAPRLTQGPRASAAIASRAASPPAARAETRALPASTPTPQISLARLCGEAEARRCLPQGWLARRYNETS